MLSDGFDALSGPSAEERVRLHSSLRTLVEGPARQLEDRLAGFAQRGIRWRVSHPMNELTGLASGVESVWRPLLNAFPDIERRDLLFFGGSYRGRTMIATLGHYCGTMRGEWLGIPATSKTIYLRYGEVWQIAPDGAVEEATLLWDVLDVMRQAKVWPLAPSLGVEEMWPAPYTTDGVRLDLSPADQSVASLEQTLQMHKALAQHDDTRLSRQSLLDMPQRDHWHPRMMWYGPAGIGTTRGLDGFVDGHQLPFRIAFSRPQGSFAEVTAERARHGAGHYIRIGDGPYSVTGGWPSVYAHHSGGGFCGFPPTGKPVFMRVMDFYLHHEGLIRENWVPLDMLHLLHQMGFDALGRMQQVLRRP